MNLDVRGTIILLIFVLDKQCKFGIKYLFWPLSHNCLLDSSIEELVESKRFIGSRAVVLSWCFVYASLKNTLPCHSIINIIIKGSFEVIQCVVILVSSHMIVIRTPL